MNIHAAVMILIVDDNPANLFSLKKVLKSSEFGIATAASGNEALAKLLETEYACILLDVNMPEMNGFELAKITAWTSTPSSYLLFSRVLTCKENPISLWAMKQEPSITF